jgi:hypothetical protein
MSYSYRSDHQTNFLYGNSIKSSLQKRTNLKLGRQKPAQCRSWQIQQQGAVPLEYKIDPKKDKKNLFYPLGYLSPPTGIDNKN